MTIFFKKQTQITKYAHWIFVTETPGERFFYKVTRIHNNKFWKVGAKNTFNYVWIKHLISVLAAYKRPTEGCHSHYVKNGEDRLPLKQRPWTGYVLSKWKLLVHTCTFLLQYSKLWDMGLVHCGICDICARSLGSPLWGIVDHRSGLRHHLTKLWFVIDHPKMENCLGANIVITGDEKVGVITSCMLPRPDTEYEIF